MNQTAEVVFRNGPVITVDPRDSIHQAAAVAGNRIVFVGSGQEARALIGPRTEVIDLEGRCLVPGFVDAHCHPGFYAAIKARIQLGGEEIKSIQDIKEAVAQRAAATPPGEWVLGWGYDDTRLAEQRLPDRDDLDQVAPDHKVFLSRACGHVVSVNSRVLQEYGIGPRTPDPEGGRIVRDSAGRPTGVLFENAKTDIENQVLPGEADLAQGMKVMSQDFLGFGVTSVHDAGYWDVTGIRLYQTGVSQGWIKLRLNFMVWYTDPETPIGDHFIASGLMTGFGNDRLKLGACKIIMDGSGGGRSAALRRPYPGDPDNYGIACHSQEELDRRVLTAHKAGYQVAVHAIGDRAIEMVLNSYERALKEHPRADPRHRIEHCGFLDEALMDRMARLGISAGLGLPFLYLLGDNYLEVFGPERLTQAYPLRSLKERGIVAALTSDAPVTVPNPMHGLYFALTHKTKAGREIAPREKVGLLEALRAYTIWGAYLGFDEHNRGSIEPGKLADLVVLSRNLLELDPEELLEVKADLTMVDGRIVHQNN